MAQEPDRRIHSGQAGGAQAGPLTASRADDTTPPGNARPDRPTTHAEETEAFLADDSPDAVERVVDRLLASPRYGEHMARYWLDAVRYGDTHGLHLDNYREMWPYRDWVVRAFNSNLPWDDFTVMQIAGDLLPEATLDDKIASGFNRCHVSTNEGGSIDEEVYVRNVVDRVSTTGTVFLGLTMGCAVCHDHKFDPITMRDFYSSFAFFNNLDGTAMDGNSPDHAPTVKSPTGSQAQELAELQEALREAEEQLATPLPEVDAAQAIWESKTRERLASENPSNLSFGTWSSVGPFRADTRYLYSRNHGPEGKDIDTSQRFRTSTGDELTWQQRPEWADGEVHVAVAQAMSALFVYRAIESDRPQTVSIGLGTDDGVKVYFNGKLVHKNQVARSVTPDEDQLKLKLKEGTNHLLLKIINEGGNSGFCFTTPEAADPTPAEVLAAIAEPYDTRTAEQKAAVRQYFRLQVGDTPQLKELVANAESLRTKIQKLDAEIPTTLVMKERAEPRAAYLLARGQYDAPDKETGPLPRAVPGFLPPLPDDAPRDRLGYAQWLIAADHPLMARVTVNRFWQQFFGTGLVATADDFGSQGAWPSHPQLLDWLAVDFQEHGWDVKRLIKQLVMSSTYQQSSKSTRQLYAADPSNRLLAHGPRFRLDAEVLRDQALAVSGLLVNRLGGPGVKPPQPDGLWKAVAFVGSNTDTFVADTELDKIHRRSLYTFWKRTSPPPQFSTLDAPSRESCVVRRERTNTPLAALLLLNDPQYVEAARKLAERSMLETAAEPHGVAESMLRLATLRTPPAVDIDRLVRMYEQSLARYQQDGEAAAKLLAVGASPVDAELDKAQLAAWTLAANAVLNLDEVLNKE